MTRNEAENRAGRLNRESADRAEHHWIAQRAGGEGWRVVRVSVPGMRFTADPLHESTQMVSRLEEPPDPRPLLIRQIPPYGPG